MFFFIFLSSFGFIEKKILDKNKPEQFGYGK